MTKSDNEAREQRILDAAAELIIHYGYDKTTVSDIAREAGISKGAIYLHFQSKDELFEALLVREIEKYTENWLDLIEADPLGGTIAGVYKNTLYALNSNRFIAALYKQDRHVLGNYVRKPGTMFQDRKNQSIRYEFVKMMQDAGAVRQDIDPQVTAHIMNIMAYGLVAMDDIMPVEDIPPTNDVIEAMGDIMVKALTPEDGGNSTAGKAIIRQVLDTFRQRLEASKPK